MPFRNRPQQEPVDPEKELARAREAMAYWKEQERDATEAILSLQGVFGWLSALTGGREQALQEAEQRLAIAIRNQKKEKQALVAARQAVEQRAQRRQVEKQQADERLLDLEGVAMQVREGDHPAAAQLEVLESGLDRAEKQLQRLQGVVAAAGGLHAAIGQIERFALQMQTRLLGMARTPEAIAAYRRLPSAIQRFNEACVDAGIEPPSLKVPREMLGQAAMDPMYWLSGDNDWAFHRLRTDLLDERDTIGMIQMQAARERQRVTGERDRLYAERRVLLVEVDSD